MTSNDTSSILDEIDLLMKSMISDFEIWEEDIEDILDDTFNLRDSFYAKSSPVNNYYSSYSIFNHQLCRRTNDIELGINSGRMSAILGEFSIDPILLNQGSIRIKIAPTATPRFNLLNEGYGYYAEMLAPISVSISSQGVVDLLMIQRFTFNVQEGANLTPYNYTSPRFTKNQEAYDPFIRIPVNQQDEIRTMLVSKITRIFNSKKVKFPVLNFGSLNIEIKPHAFFFRDNILVFTTKILPPRRTPEQTLKRIAFGFNQSVSIHRDIVSKEIRRQAPKGSSVNHIKYYYRYLVISTRKSDVRRFFHIKVTSAVKMEHYLRLTVSRRTIISLDATWKSWEYDIKSERCWPVCSKVMSAAKSLVMNIINNNKYFTRRLADLRVHADWVRTNVSPSGVQIDFRTR